MRLWYFIFFFFITYHISGAQVRPHHQKLKDIRKEIQDKIDQISIPSMAVAVIANGEIIWLESLGYSNIEKKIPTDINALYPLGSVSKSITATGIMHLINAHKIDLFEDISPYLDPVVLKDIDGNTPKILLWQLISMNGGVSHSYGTFTNEMFIPKKSASKKNFFGKTAILAFQPGAVYEYSNNAFYLAELIAENISGHSFQNYMDANVFKKLGLQNTVVYPHKNREGKSYVSLYSGNMKPLDNYINYPAGGSGIWSSIADLTKYAKFHLGLIKNGRVLTDENLELMHNFRQGPADLFGIGWFNSGKSLYSDGMVPGANAVIILNKEEKFGVICLLNKSSNGFANEIAEKIRDVFIKEKDNGYMEWLRIYGTKYRKKYDLLGKWEGLLKEPITDRSVAVQLFFSDSGGVFIILNKRKIKLNNVSYNLLSEFQADFNVEELPEIYNRATYCRIKLKKEKKVFSRYLQYDRREKGSFYRLPLFLRAEKK